MMLGDIEKMMIVGLIWGTTNALMKKGATVYDTVSSKSSSSSSSETGINSYYYYSSVVKNLLLTWQYSIPLLVNLSASATFFALVGHTPISLAVPVTNATTFCATAVVGFFLGEDIRLVFALFGTFLIVLGVFLCVS